MFKYLFPFVLFLLSMVSVFAQNMSGSIVVWKSSGTGVLGITPFQGWNPQSSAQEKPIPQSEEKPKTIAPEDTPIKQNSGTYRRVSYFQYLRSPIPTSVFYDDASLLRFVSRYRSLNDTSYAPENLVSISGAYIDEAGRKGYLRAEAREALTPLAKAFYDKFGGPLIVISGYRSATYQQRLWDLGRCTDSLCAPSGYSEHQLGLAIDVFDASTASDFEQNARYKKYISWLQDNAHLYGWHQSYQKGESIDTYQIEPWHWRYMGIDMATKLRELGWSYAEYVRFQESIQRR
jgi:LAS superfamily LD-carboxypeptidase LdcB